MDDPHQNPSESRTVGHSPAPRRSLDVVTTPSPCEEPWDEMKVVGHTQRFCGMCSQNVYDISMLSREAAEELIFGSAESVCVRLHRRYDGTVITSDCAPVRFRLLRKTGDRALTTGARVLAAGLAILAGLGVARAAGFDVVGWIAGTAVGSACGFGSVTTAGAAESTGDIGGL